MCTFPTLILKLYISYKSYLPYNRQTGTLSIKSNGKDNKIEYSFNFLIICRYFNLATSEDNFIVR